MYGYNAEDQNKEKWTPAMTTSTEQLLKDGYVKNTEEDLNDIFSWGEFYKVSIANGQKHGPYIAVSNEGVRTVTGEYTNNIRTGWWTVFWSDGFQPYENGPFDAEGKKTGEWTSNGHDGRLRSQGNYREDKKSGKWIFNDDTNSPIFFINDEEVTEREWNKYERQLQKGFKENEGVITGVKNFFAKTFSKLVL